MMSQDSSVLGIPADFVLFGVTLTGIAIFHQCTMRVASTGLVTITIYKIGCAISLSYGRRISTHTPLTEATLTFSTVRPSFVTVASIGVLAS